MRRVLFDENLPRRLRRNLEDFEIRTVQEEGWGSYTNNFCDEPRRRSTSLSRPIAAWSTNKREDLHDRHRRHHHATTEYERLRSCLDRLRTALTTVAAGQLVRIATE